MSEKIKQGAAVLASKTVTNYNKSGLSSIDSVAVGNLEAYNVLKEDAEVYEFVNAVLLGPDNRAQLDAWTDIELTPEWAQSFADAVKAAPKPLFIRGHAEFSVSGKERVVPDGYVTGGLVLGNTLYLRNSFFKTGTDEKKALIEQTVKEIKANMLSTSTYDYMKYKIITEEDSYDETYFAIESVKAQSNALVEADQTGSDAAIILTSFKASDGKEDEKERGEELMSERVTNVEHFTALKNQLDAGSLALKDVAAKLGIEMKTNEDKVALKRLSDAETIVGDISVYVAQEQSAKAQAFKDLKESKLKAKFSTDELFEVAEPMFSLKEGTAAEIDAECERIAAMKVFEKIQGALAGSINASFSNSETSTADEADDMEG